MKNHREELRSLIQDAARRLAKADPALKTMVAAGIPSPNIQLALRGGIAAKLTTFAKKALPADDVEALFAADPFLPEGGSSDFDSAVARGVALAVGFAFGQRR